MTIDEEIAAAEAEFVKLLAFEVTALARKDEADAQWLECVGKANDAFHRLNRLQHQKQHGPRPEEAR